MSEERTQQSRVHVELGTEAQPALVRFSSAWLPGSISSLDSYALRTTAGWVLVDPLDPTADGAARLRRLIGERLVATILTSDGHERDCYAARERWGTPVWGPTLGEAQRDAAYEGTPDHLYGEGDTLPGGLHAIKLAGAWRGDHGLLWPAPTGERVLFSGDILNGQVETDLLPEDHYRREPGLYFGARPNYPERHANRATLKASLERLLREEFDVIAGSHGRPFRENPKAALTRLIETL
jgi:hypothetical protein